MYSQIQLPIPIHGNTIECAFKINIVLGFIKVVKLKNYFRVDSALTIGIGTCITYFTDSDIIKNCWYWPDTNTDTRNRYSPNLNHVCFYLSVIQMDK